MSLYEFRFVKRKAQFEVVAELHRQGHEKLADRQLERLAGSGKHTSANDCLAFDAKELELVHNLIKQQFEKINGPKRPYHQFEKFLERSEDKVERAKEDGEI